MILTKLNAWLEKWRRGVLANEVSVRFGFSLRDARRIVELAEFDHDRAFLFANYIIASGSSLLSFDEALRAMRRQEVRP